MAKIQGVFDTLEQVARLLREKNLVELFVGDQALMGGLRVSGLGGSPEPLTYKLLECYGYRTRSSFLTTSLEGEKLYNLALEPSGV